MHSWHQSNTLYLCVCVHSHPLSLCIFIFFLSRLSLSTASPHISSPAPTGIISAFTYLIPFFSERTTPRVCFRDERDNDIIIMNVIREQGSSQLMLFICSPVQVSAARDVAICWVCKWECGVVCVWLFVCYKCIFYQHVFGVCVTAVWCSYW